MSGVSFQFWLPSSPSPMYEAEHVRLLRYTGLRSVMQGGRKLTRRLLASPSQTGVSYGMSETSLAHLPRQARRMRTERLPMLARHKKRAYDTSARCRRVPSGLWGQLRYAVVAPHAASAQGPSPPAGQLYVRQRYSSPAHVQRRIKAWCKLGEKGTAYRATVQRLWAGQTGWDQLQATYSSPSQMFGGVPSLRSAPGQQLAAHQRRSLLPRRAGRQLRSHCEHTLPSGGRAAVSCR